MTRRTTTAALLALVAGGLHLGYVVPAHATPVGRLCSFWSVTDPTVEGGQTQTGEINAGPVTDDTQVGATITVTCTIQVGAANSTHADTDAVACASTGTGAVSVACQASYVSPEGQPVYLCTEVTVHGTTTYYRDSVAGTWSSSPSVSCEDAAMQQIHTKTLSDLIPQLAPVVDQLAQQVLSEVVQPTICPVLAVLFPPEGDVVLLPAHGTIWDCDPSSQPVRDHSIVDVRLGGWLACAGTEDTTLCT